MSNGDDDLSRSHPGGPVSEKLVAMVESPQLATRLLAEPAEHRTCSHESDSSAELRPRKGRTGELQGEGLNARGLVYRCNTLATPMHY